MPNARSFGVFDAEIALMTREGWSAAEIACVLRVSEQAVARALRRLPLTIQPRGGARCIAVKLPRVHASVIKALADRAQVSPSELLARIAGLVVAEGAAAASKRLGKAGRPKRGYRKAAA